MFPAFKRTRMLLPTSGERGVPSTGKAFLFFLAVFGLSSLARSVISAIQYLVAPMASDTIQLLVQLFATAAAVVITLLWVRRYERRSYLSMGLTRRGACADYLVGIPIGVLLLGGSVAICLCTGVSKMAAAENQPPWWLILLFFVGYLIQGMSEELLCRSFLMVSLSRRWPLWACAMANSAAFSALHLFNPGISPIALLNIFLFGIFASLLTLRRGSVWMAAAAHSLWNFAQGNLFGMPVSGLTGSASPFVTLHTGEPDGWQSLIHGGTFGVEGGLAATVILLLGIGLLLLIPTKRSEVAE